MQQQGEQAEISTRPPRLRLLFMVAFSFGVWEGVPADLDDSDQYKAERGLLGVTV